MRAVDESRACLPCATCFAGGIRDHICAVSILLCIFRFSATIHSYDMRLLSFLMYKLIVMMIVVRFRFLVMQLGSGDGDEARSSSEDSDYEVFQSRTAMGPR